MTTATMDAPAFGASHSGTTPPHILMSWLQDRGSLTLKLKNLCRRFEVQLLSEGMAPAQESGPSWQQGEQIWQRQVLLKLDGIPWVYANTEVPLEAVQGSSIDFASLGNQPLGERLFAADDLIRGPIEVRHYDDHSTAANHARLLGMPVDNGLWGRQREFSVNALSLRVTEVFLPFAAARLS
ncbi:chorismate--pyruvate lyase family protein [Ferrimonas aestuarii]|uniref:Probable chorismate pyruvate-lyase n=1 Tax=Ferrimonas aestuarii TaxID=2569539 RepID=A0A4U1BPW4_9GAMM|nr:chorismate lyase [Ferrimonas aestuarii]TKB56268.1 chorismate lyase [Ferrimonas aestuarii]